MLLMTQKLLDYEQVDLWLNTLSTSRALPG